MIKFSNVSFAYNHTTIIKDFNFDIQQGEIVSFFGPSGCGKSTILKSILGITKPIKGDVSINNIQSTKYPYPIAYTPQDNQLLPRLSVKDNILLRQKESLQKKASPINGLDISTILKIIEMDHKSDVMPDHISGGMARRTALGRCIATQSEVMCLDEVLVSVERKFRRRVMNNLRKYIKNNTITCCLISHDYEEVMFMSDRVVILSAFPAEVVKIVTMRDIGLPEERDIQLFDEDTFDKASKILFQYTI